jgi:hypothetical protein
MNANTLRNFTGGDAVMARDLWEPPAPHEPIFIPFLMRDIPPIIMYESEDDEISPDLEPIYLVRFGPNLANTMGHSIDINESKANEI